MVMNKPLNPERAEHILRYKRIIRSTDLTDTDTQQDIDLFSLRNRNAVVRVTSIVRTEFDDTAGTGTSLTFQVGTAADPDRFLTVQQVQTDNTVDTVKQEELDTEPVTAALTVQLRAISTGVNLNLVDSGEYLLTVEIVDYDVVKDENPLAEGV